jgi:hypothetical protein
LTAIAANMKVIAVSIVFLTVLIPAFIWTSRNCSPFDAGIILFERKSTLWPQI